MARAWACLALCRAAAAAAVNPPTFSAGFSDDAVLQRGRAASVYGFASGSSSPRVSVSVAGLDAAGASSRYEVQAEVSRFGSAGFLPDTGTPPPHGPWVWRAKLRPAAAGGEYTVTVSDDAGGSTAIERVTFGDVWFCSGQSNMALATYFTFSSDALRKQVSRGQYANIRHFQFGEMGLHYEATEPQWVTSQGSTSADAKLKWYNLTSSAGRSISGKGLPEVSDAPYDNFGATCMYFGVELADAMASQGLESTPIGLIQSAIGGSQIEAWMNNETLRRCTDTSPSGGAVPQNSGALYYGMVAPFANYSVRGWVWYQGENNAYGIMGSSESGQGYGCELPAMVGSWRAAWDAQPDALFGIVTLVAGTSEGHGWKMAGMRWSQTANYGVWPNPALPHSFGAQAYDLEDPWAYVGDGNKRDNDNASKLQCCFDMQPHCGGAGNPAPCGDKLNCSNPDISTGRYGSECSPWDSSLWSPSLRSIEQAVRGNSPSGVAANSFMGPIHPRVKRPVGRRLAVAAARQMAGNGGKGAGTGPTISGCSYASGSLELLFNSSLLGGEGLRLGNFNSNAASWAPEPSWNPPSWVPRASTAYDSLGTMVCLVNGSEPEKGNLTTCMCQGWDFLTEPLPGGDLRATFYCEVGPGWKPSASRRALEAEKRAGLAAEQRLGWVPPENPFAHQWRPVALRASTSTNSVIVDTSGLEGLEPVAVRLAWPLFDSPYIVGDTCCPASDVRSGRAPCVPGSCPLYTSASELPVNPFFARIVEGRCQCASPQKCDATGRDALEARSSEGIALVV